MTFDRSKLINALLSGLHKGWHSAVWLLKILIPISFLTFLIDYAGWLNKIDFLLTPLMHVLSLPSAAALPLLIGLFTGIYGGIAAMAVLPFTTDQMTLMAIFLLISHNLFQESIIQGCSGLNGWAATIIRLAASITAVMLTAPFLGLEGQALPPAGGIPPGDQSLGALLPAWGLATLLLTLKIIIIIVALTVLLECMKTYRLIRYLGVVMNPLMRLMGLDQRAGFLWMTAAVFGLSYGGAIIVEEVKSGQLDSADLTRLQLSIGVNHSVIEDPVLFLPLGIGPFWLWIPRLLIAMLIVWGHMALVRIQRWVRIGIAGNRRKRSGS